MRSHHNYSHTRSHHYNIGISNISISYSFILIILHDGHDQLQLYQFLCHCTCNRIHSQITVNNGSLIEPTPKLLVYRHDS